MIGINAASQIDPSSFSPSPNITNTLWSSLFIFALYAIPLPIDKPCPREPVNKLSTPGIPLWET